MTLATRIIGTQQLQAGDTVGYGSRFTAEGPLTIGVAACGYADGYPRHCDIGTPVLVNGVRTRLVGRVSMDMVTVDLSPVIAAGVDAGFGSEVTLWGRARSGAVLLVLSDRDISPDTLPIPAAMAVGAVQRTLVDNNLRCDANILVETASVRDPHHFAVLLGFGATAIYPYLAYETLAKQVEEGVLKMSLRQAMLNYRNGINKGLYKVMSKMGISTVASYRCSQLFEAVGLSSSVVELCFRGVSSRIQGADFTDIQQDQVNLARQAWLGRKPLTQGGLLKFVHGGEYHTYNPDGVQTPQVARGAFHRVDAPFQEAAAPCPWAIAHGQAFAAQMFHFRAQKMGGSAEPAPAPQGVGQH